MASFSVLTAFWIIKTSQAKERSGVKQRGKTNKMKKTEDSSCSLTSHFWSTYRSPFSTCCIPFQISGSQESNASNRVRFGAEMRKIWPSEDNCIKPWEHHFARWRKFRKEIFFMVRNLAISHHEDPPCEIWTLHLSPFENAFEILCFSTHAPPTS